MKMNDLEHKAFIEFAKDRNLDLRMHPLHLIYLDEETSNTLNIFKEGFSSARKNNEEGKIARIREFIEQESKCRVMRSMDNTTRSNAMKDVLNFIDSEVLE